MPHPFTHLSLEERRQLSRLRESRTPVAEIAVALRRHRSTIHRELKRNSWRDAEVPQAAGWCRRRRWLTDFKQSTLI